MQPQSAFQHSLSCTSCSSRLIFFDSAMTASRCPFAVQEGMTGERRWTTRRFGSDPIPGRKLFCPPPRNRFIPRRKQPWADRNPCPDKADIQLSHHPRSPHTSQSLRTICTSRFLRKDNSCRFLCSDRSSPTPRSIYTCPSLRSTCMYEDHRRGQRFCPNLYSAHICPGLRTLRTYPSPCIYRICPSPRMDYTSWFPYTTYRHQSLCSPSKKAFLYRRKPYKANRRELP